MSNEVMQVPLKDKGKAMQYNNAFNRQKYDRISVMVQKGQKEQIQAAASRQGQSLNAYIVGAVNERMEREQPEEREQKRTGLSILDTMRQIAASGKSVVELTQESIAATGQNAQPGDNSIISVKDDAEDEKVDLPF